MRAKNMFMFKRSFCVLLLCVFFACYAAAWGEQTQEYICDAAVEKAWGSALANKCLAQTADNKAALCSLLREVRGEEEYLSCMRLSSVHPALVPYRLFNDTALHYNYAVCPISKTDTQLRSWACNASSRNLAMEQASFWLDSMNKSGGCDRIYRFCIGANYFSDSFMPLYQVMYATPASIEEMDARVDKLISEGKTPWGIDVSAAFQAKSRPRSVRKFEVNSKMFDDIINRLAAAAGKQPESTTQTTVATCYDGIMNQAETGIDCGGSCKACQTNPRVESCSDGLQNQGETGVDCGGPCGACPQPEKPGWSIPDYLPGALMGVLFVGAAFLMLFAAGTVVLFIVRSRKKRPNAKKEISEDAGLDEIGGQLDDIRSALKRLE
jgi:hypothetical protein